MSACLHFSSAPPAQIQDEIVKQLTSFGGSTGKLCESWYRHVDLLDSLLLEINSDVAPLMHYINFAKTPQDALSKEGEFKSDCAAVSDHCPPPPLVNFRSNWIVTLLQKGARKLNSPAPVSACHPDWHGVTRCSGPLVINDYQLHHITAGWRRPGRYCLIPGTVWHKLHVYNGRNWQQLWCS